MDKDKDKKVAKDEVYDFITRECVGSSSMRPSPGLGWLTTLLSRQGPSRLPSRPDGDDPDSPSREAGTERVAREQSRGDDPATDILVAKVVEVCLAEIANERFAGGIRAGGKLLVDPRLFALCEKSCQGASVCAVSQPLGETDGPWVGEGEPVGVESRRDLKVNFR